MLGVPLALTLSLSEAPAGQLRHGKSLLYACLFIFVLFLPVFALIVLSTIIFLMIFLSNRPQVKMVIVGCCRHSPLACGLEREESLESENWGYWV